MGKISISPLFKKTLVLIVALFGIIATATSLVSGWTLYSQLTGAYQSKGAAIAKSIADSSVEVLLNRDASTLQAFVDQFTEIEGVSYVFVADNSGEILSHTLAKERIESEIKIAHDIQMSMVPKTFPPFPDRREFDLYATLVPAEDGGGDFYDFFFLDEDHLCFAIGDVSGKGVPASLFMAVTKTLFKAITRRTGSPDGILSFLNEEICRDNSSCMFVTLFGAILDIRTGRVEYSNGGHNLPYLLSHGRLRPLDNTGGTVLGAMEGVRYYRQGLVLQPGDRLLLYTDGVTEAMDGSESLFSERRLEEFLAAVNDASSEDLTRGLVSELRRFAAGAAQSDDITILALQYWGVEHHAGGKDIS